MRVLVTGGAGYIGSHTVLLLLEAGHEVAVIDNLVNSSAESLSRVERLTGASVRFVEANVRDAAALDALAADVRPEAVIHFAGLKAVGESTQQPVRYYQENLDSTLALLTAMADHGCRSIVFSSSATVYGASEPPFAEDSPTGATNPYGRTKHMIEQILADAAVADPQLAVGVLRYFNPIGAHPSGEIGEDPQGIPNNLLPFVAQVASGRRERLTVFGDDYDTPDGSGVRDYIHVMDLAQGHLAALEHLTGHPGYHVWNLGSGEGTSVFDVVAAYERASGVPIPLTVAPRRPGDVARSFADASKAARELGWSTTRDIDEMCADTARWQRRNPHGYGA